MITPAQLDTLKAVAHHRNAIQVHRSAQTSDWVWEVGGVARSGTIDRLLRAGFLEHVDPAVVDVLVLSAKGRRALET